MIIDILLDEKKMSKYKLSKESGVPQATISDICSGKTAIEKCAAGTLHKMAKVLEVTVDELLEAEEKSKNKNAEYRSSFENKDILLEFQDDYPNVLNGDNIKDILMAARRKKNEIK